MRGSGEEQRETIRPEFNPAIMIDFQGAKSTSDTGFLLLREIDERFGILGPIATEQEETSFRGNHPILGKTAAQFRFHAPVFRTGALVRILLH